MGRMQSFVFLSCLICVCRFAPAEDAPSNLIRNPGFEEPGSPPLHWKPSTTALKLPAFGTYDTEIKHGGARSFKMARELDEQNTYWYQDDIKVEPESDYVCSGWIKAQNIEGKQGGYLSILGLPAGASDATKRIFSLNLKAVKGTQDWQECSALFRTPPGTDHIRLLLQFGRCSGTIWFDDLYLRRAAEDEASLLPPLAREGGIATWHSFNDVLDGMFVGASPRHVKASLSGSDVKFTKDGRLGGAIEFTGPNGSVAIDTVSAGESATVEMWIFRRAQREPPAHGEVIVRGENWELRIDQKTRKNCLALVRDGDGKEAIFSKSEIPLDKWTHIAFTHDNTTTISKIYINGELDAESDRPAFEPFSGKLSLGGVGPGDCFVGKIDELAIFNRAKPPEEIRRDMSLTKPAFSADNGVIKLSFMQGEPRFLLVFQGGRLAGKLGAAIAQFEKGGIGYKKTGIGSAYATGVKGIDVKKREDSECVVDVTVERSESAEIERKFEATYRITLRPGRSWFESRLVSVKNTDTVRYDLRGYYHLLQPPTAAVEARSYGSVGGWIGRSPSVGAINRAKDDFTLGFRKREGRVYGEITRPLKATLKPDEVWQGNEPAVVIFVVNKKGEKEFYRSAIGIKADIAKGGGPGKGSIVYEENRSAAGGK